MPKKSVWLVRTGLVYFLGGTTIGGALQIHKAVPLFDGLWALRPLHVELLLIGFMLHLAFGVALWILPKPGRPPSDRAVWIAAGLLNAGIWLIGLGGGVLQSGLMELLGRILEIAAVALFASQIVPRVRSIESFRKA